MFTSLQAKFAAFMHPDGGELFV